MLGSQLYAGRIYTETKQRVIRSYTEQQYGVSPNEDGQHYKLMLSSAENIFS